MAHRLAVATSLATFVLILLGGLVTNTGSALAVPDWPTTFGHNMFLYPWSGMVGGIFYEHSHRLIGALVGLLTLALAGALWPAGGRLRTLGLVAAGAVCVQGVLGGLRVVLLRETLAIVHGCLAQAFFALIVLLAFLTSARAGTAVREIDATSRSLAAGAALLVYLQIVLGAFLTHGGWLDLHLAGAVAVFAFLPVVTARLRRSGDRVAASLSGVLLALLGVQLLLGVGSYLSRFSPIWIPGGQLTMLAMPVAHRLAASLILAASVVLAVRVASARGTEPAAVGARLAPRLSS
jgi:cytochrome c oxidase assembly protein subunit 15